MELALTTLLERVSTMSSELHAKLDTLAADFAGLKTDIDAFASKSAVDMQSLKDSLAAALAKGEPPAPEDLAALDAMDADVKAMRAKLTPASAPEPVPAPVDPAPAA